MKKYVGFKNNNNNLNNKKTSINFKNKKKFNNEFSKKDKLIFKESKEENQKYNHTNKSIDFKNIRNKTKKNNQNKKIKNINNKLSLSLFKEINDSEDQKISKDINIQIKYLNNKNKNNSVILNNTENIYSENNILLLSNGKPKNIDLKKYNNGSSYNIRVNKPTKLILDKDISINDLYEDKSFHNKNNITYETYRNKNDLNKTFNCQENNNNLPNFKFNNGIKNKNIQDKDSSLNNIVKNKLEENQNKNIFQNSIICNKSKGLNHFNTSKNLTLQRENINNNEINKARMKSIDNVKKLSLNRRMKWKNRKLNSEQIQSPININKRLLSPSLINHKKILANDISENFDNKDTEEIIHKFLFKLSMKELLIERNKLIDEINQLRIQMKQNLDKKELEYKINSL